MKKKIVITLGILSILSLNADNLKDSVDLTQKGNANSVKSQKKIDTLVDKKEILYSKYKKLSYELKSLNAYNKELNEIIVSQNSEKKSILKQIDQIDETKREILPLIKNMLSSLDDLIKNDTPFLYKERTQRVKRLKDLIKRSDISIASKYRSVIEAYEIETEYSRTIETYNDILDDKSVKFLRLGRVALYYVSEDNKECALWDNGLKQWHILDQTFAYKINSAIKIASKKGVPDLLTLPMFKAKEVM